MSNGFPSELSPTSPASSATRAKQPSRPSSIAALPAGRVASSAPYASAAGGPSAAGEQGRVLKATNERWWSDGTRRAPVGAQKMNGAAVLHCTFCSRAASGFEALTNLDPIGDWHREILPICARCDGLLKEAGDDGLVLKATNARWWRGHSAALLPAGRPAFPAWVGFAPAIDLPLPPAQQPPTKPQPRHRMGVASTASDERQPETVHTPNAPAAAPETAGAALADLLARYEPVGLGDLERVALLNRVDTKYLLSDEQLLDVFVGLSGHYGVLEIDGKRLHHYRTVYFDTPDMALYRLHHAGKLVRDKVRSREYVESGLSFFEIKQKTNKGLTVKHRLRTGSLNASMTPDTEEFLSSRAPQAGPDLSPVLANDFLRATLVNLAEAGVGERITVDIGLTFAANGREVPLPGTAIVEVKQRGVNRSSPAMQALSAAKVLPTSVSKYCLGVSLLYEDVKHNSFKPKLLAIKKLMREAGYV